MHGLLKPKLNFWWALIQSFYYSFSEKRMINCMIYTLTLNCTFDYIKMFTDLRYSKMILTILLVLKRSSGLKYCLLKLTYAL